MLQLTYSNNIYRTSRSSISWFAKVFPELTVYGKFIGVVFRGSAKAKRGLYTDDEWCVSSMDSLRALESVGVQIEVNGIEHLAACDGPCVIIGNHMSMLETVVLPIIIQPARPVTFVVKESLLTYPVFGHIMRSRNPVAVTRTNPREDFKTVMTEGLDRLQRGISVIVFPQTTRTPEFISEEFNTIGMKLAHRAGVPVVPLALKTDAWGNGTFLKDFGKIDTSKKVHFTFGKPLSIRGRGGEEHQEIIHFITTHLEAWRK